MNFCSHIRKAIEANAATQFNFSMTMEKHFSASFHARTVKSTLISIKLVIEAEARTIRKFSRWVCNQAAFVHELGQRWSRMEYVRSYLGLCAQAALNLVIILPRCVIRFLGIRWFEQGSCVKMTLESYCGNTFVPKHFAFSSLFSALYL